LSQTYNETEINILNDKMYIFQMLESVRNESYSYIINETKVSQKIIQSQPSEQFLIYIMASYID